MTRSIDHPDGPCQNVAEHRYRRPSRPGALDGEVLWLCWNCDVTGDVRIIEHRTSTVATSDGQHRAECSCGWASRQTWKNRDLAIADGNGHFAFAG